MAEYRQIHTQLWKDSWVLDLSPDRKLLFIYLFSNERANLSGIYELPVRVMAFETGLPQEMIEESLRYFGECGKVEYDFLSSYVWVRNLLRYNAKNERSPKIRAHLDSLMASLSDSCPFKSRWLELHGYPIHTVSIPDLREQKEAKEQEQEHEQEQEQEKEHDHDQEQEQEQEKEHDHDHDQEQEQEKEHDHDQEMTTNQKASSAATAALTTTNLLTAVGLLRLALGSEPNRLDRETLAEMVDEFEAWRRGLPEGEPGAGVDGEGWVAAAIREANAARDPGRHFRLTFVQAILRRWRREGFQAPWNSHMQEQGFADASFWGEKQTAGEND